MENGSIWGHGAYLGPDFSAEYLHRLSTKTADSISMERYGRPYSSLDSNERGLIDAQVRESLRTNRYDPQTGILSFGTAEIASFKDQVEQWTRHFQLTTTSAGLPSKFIQDPQELQQLTAFFAWTAWASAAQRPGRTHSYTNNFPFDPTVGNSPTGNAVLWSALSLITLLGGIGIVLFAFGKFSFLGW